MAGPRVLFISGDFPPTVSGVGDFVDKLAEAMIKAGADVTVLTGVSSNEGDTRRPFRVLRSMDGWGYNQMKIALREAREDYDIIDFQYPAVNYGRGLMVNFLPALMKLRNTPGRTVVTVHDFRVMRRRWQSRVAPMMWAADGLIHVDEKDWRWMNAWGVSDAKPRAHVPIAANAEPVAVNNELRKQWRKELGFEADETVVAFFGILYPHKGLAELIGAVRDLRGQARNVRLLVLGDFDRQAPCRSEIEIMLSDPAVRWVKGASLEQISRALHTADLAALPFHTGASTNRGSMLAALAHGLPTITTRGPATPMDFGRQFDVQLVPVKDRVALSNAIARVMDDPALMERMRASAVSRRRTWSAVAAETLAFYSRLLKVKGAALGVA
jgi:glycosyltransferase involved in cell wall biosynthesis